MVNIVSLKAIIVLKSFIDTNMAVMLNFTIKITIALLNIA
jgi:hypothetical protein